MDMGRMEKKKKKKKKKLVTMDFVPPEEGRSCPLVGYFPSGFDPLRFQQEQETQSLNVSAYQNTEKYKTRQHQVVVSPSDASVDFVGTNYLGEGAMWQPGNYALGVFDKDSLSLQLVPLSGTKVLRMEPRVRGQGYDTDFLSGAPDIEMTKELLREKRQLLTATFGTQKSRIKQNRYERGRVKEDALGDKMEIERFFKKAGDNIALLTTEATVKHNIPPHNTTATTPEEAFPFDEIVSPEEQNSLDDIDVLMLAIGEQEKINELREKNNYPEFVLKRLSTMTYMQEKRKARGVMILSYIRHLLAFYHLPKKVVESIVDPTGSQSSNSIDVRRYRNIPNTVAAKILECFTTVNQDEALKRKARTQSSEKRDLLISYIVVLGLMIDNFRADPFDLAVELKKSISGLKPYYVQLGCKFKLVREADREVMDLSSPQRLYEAILSLPLQFPALKSRKFRRKR